MTNTSKDVERIEAESVPQADLCDTSDPQADSVERLKPERFEPDFFGRIMVRSGPGRYVTYEDYAALAAQLADANARADRARDDALVEASAACEAHRYKDDFLDACNLRRGHRSDIAASIQALRTQPTPSVEPMTAHWSNTALAGMIGKE